MISPGSKRSQETGSKLCPSRKAEDVIGRIIDRTDEITAKELGIERHESIQSKESKKNDGDITETNTLYGVSGLSLY